MCVHIDHRQLQDMAADVDEQNRIAMQTMSDELGELHFGSAGEELRDARRRSFLTKAAIAAPLVAVGAATMPITRFLPSAFAADGAAPLTDLDIAAYAVTVELAAVAAYQAAIKTGKLSPGSVTVGKSFAGHHNQHAGAFAALIGQANGKAPTTANAAVLKAFGPMIASAPDEAAVLNIAYQIEEAAAATYLYSLGALNNKVAAGAVATILPIESQHAVVLGTALKKPTTAYLPSFQNQTAALDPAKYPPGPAASSSSSDTGGTSS
jgi:rubrerythrin